MGKEEGKKSAQKSLQGGVHSCELFLMERGCGFYRAGPFGLWVLVGKGCQWVAASWGVRVWPLPHLGCVWRRAACHLPNTLAEDETALPVGRRWWEKERGKG